MGLYLSLYPTNRKCILISMTSTIWTSKWLKAIMTSSLNSINVKVCMALISRYLLITNMVAIIKYLSTRIIMMKNLMNSKVIIYVPSMIRLSKICSLIRKTWLVKTKTITITIISIKHLLTKTQSLN